MCKKQNQLPGNINPNPNGWQCCRCKNLTENIYKSPKLGRHNCSSQPSRRTQAGCRHWSLQALLWAILVEEEEPGVRLTALGGAHVQAEVGKVCSWLNPATETSPVSWSNLGAPTFYCSGSPCNLHHQQLWCCSINGTENKLLFKKMWSMHETSIIKVKEMYAYRLAVWSQSTSEPKKLFSCKS